MLEEETEIDVNLKILFLVEKMVKTQTSFAVSRGKILNHRRSLNPW